MAIRALITLATKIVKGVFNIVKNIFSGSSSSISRFVYGGIAVAAGAFSKKLLSSSKKGMAASPSYQGIQYTQIDPDMPLPLIYGTVQVAGNLLWQNSTDKFTQKIIAFSEGEIDDFTDIKINDIPISSIAGCTVQKFFGTSTQAVSSFVSGATQADKIKTVGSLKNVAYLAISANHSQKIGSDFNVTTVIRGKKVRVYTSETTYSVQYSENPVWILFDFLTAYNGLGLGLNDDSTLDNETVSGIFDIQSFIEAAAYCDEKISYTTTDDSGNSITATQSRFTFNMVFDVQTSVRTLLDEIYRSCRGGLFFKNGLLQCKIDKPEVVSKVFKAEDISNEIFKTVPNEEHYDILKAVYISQKHEWQKVEAFAELEERRSGVPVEYSVDIYSCTNFHQASRLAWYYLNSKSLQPYFGSFDTDFRAFDLEVGDVIKFDSALMGLNGYKVKVTQITDDGAGTFTVDWQTYDERLYSDAVSGFEPHILVSKNTDFYRKPDDVLNFNVVQSLNTFNFSWSQQENLKYEIREGTDWITGNVVGTNISGDVFSSKITRCGLHHFMIKSFNGYNYAANPAVDLVYVDSIPESNIILNKPILTNDGTFDNSKLYQNILKLECQNILWQKINTKWDGDEVEKLAINGLWGVGKKNGSFLSEVFDLGKFFRSKVSLEKEIFGNCEIFFRYADAEQSLTEKAFVRFTEGEYSFRYFQFKVVLQSDVGEISYIKNCIANIDVPDKTAHYSIEITNSEEGIVLDYSDVGFYSVPKIVATVNENISAFPIVTEKTTESAKIFAITNHGAKTSATIDVQVTGY